VISFISWHCRGKRSLVSGNYAPMSKFFATSLDTREVTIIDQFLLLVAVQWRELTCFENPQAGC